MCPIFPVPWSNFRIKFSTFCIKIVFSKLQDIVSLVSLPSKDNYIAACSDFIMVVISLKINSLFICLYTLIDLCRQCSYVSTVFCATEVDRYYSHKVVS